MASSGRGGGGQGQEALDEMVDGFQAATALQDSRVRSSRDFNPLPAGSEFRLQQQRQPSATPARDLNAVALRLSVPNEILQSAPPHVNMTLVPNRHPGKYVQVYLNPSGTTIGWDGVPRRPPPSSSSRSSSAATDSSRTLTNAASSERTVSDASSCTLSDSSRTLSYDAASRSDATSRALVSYFSRTVSDPLVVESDGFLRRQLRRRPPPRITTSLSPPPMSRKREHDAAEEEQPEQANELRDMTNLMPFSNVKADWLFADSTNSFHRQNPEDDHETQRRRTEAGAACKTRVHFDLGVPSSYAANSQSGPWGTVPISVKLRPSRACTNLDRLQPTKTSSSSSPRRHHSAAAETLAVDSSESYTNHLQAIADWWSSSRPNDNKSAKKIRDIILWKLPVAKLFALGWPSKSLRKKLQNAHTRTKLHPFLKHNKEYCPTMFSLTDYTLWAFHQQAAKWVQMPALTFVPIEISRMLAGEGGLLLLAGSIKPKLKKKKLPFPKYDTKLRYPPQSILVVCNPIARTYQLLPPLTINLKHTVARMSVARLSDSYVIRLMGWDWNTAIHDDPALSFENQLHVCVYHSSTMRWVEHSTIFQAPCRPQISTLGFFKALPMVKMLLKGGRGPAAAAHMGEGENVIFTMAEIPPQEEEEEEDPHHKQKRKEEKKKKRKNSNNNPNPEDCKRIVIAYTLDSLNWVSYNWIKGRNEDLPTLLDCNDELYAIARCMEGTRVFIQVHKLTSVALADGASKFEFLRFAPPLPDRYYDLLFPRRLYPPDRALDLNCISGKGNIWMAAQDECSVMFLNIKTQKWNYISSLQFDLGEIYLGNWAFEPSPHAQP